MTGEGDDLFRLSNFGRAAPSGSGASATAAAGPVPVQDGTPGQGATGGDSGPTLKRLSSTTDDIEGEQSCENKTAEKQD